MIFENLLLALWQALDTFIVKDLEHTAICGPWLLYYKVPAWGLFWKWEEEVRKEGSRNIERLRRWRPNIGLTSRGVCLNVSHELKMKAGFEVQACKDTMQMTWTRQGVNRKLGRKGMSRSWHLSWAQTKVFGECRGGVGFNGLSPHGRRICSRRQRQQIKLGSVCVYE